MVRLNSQQRTNEEVPPELHAYCCQDPATQQFTVPSIEKLRQCRRRPLFAKPNPKSVKFT
jgi:hypothetical protein